MMGRILAGRHDGVYLLRLEGDVRLTLCAAADEYLQGMFEDPEFKSVLLDLRETEGIDSTTLGLLAKVSIRAQAQHGFMPTLVCQAPDILRILHSMGFEDVFHIVPEMPAEPGDLVELPEVAASESELRETVLESHRVLMELNESNRELFQDLVDTLESDQAGKPVRRRSA